MIAAESFGFRDDITLEGDSAYLDTVQDVNLVIVGPEGERVVKVLSASTDRDPVTKRWSWFVGQGDLVNPGVHRYQIVDVTAGRNIASSVGYFNVGPRI